jgi:AcrR family transcriptional regulator
VAIIVNKEEKRNSIACSCKEILLQHGINNLTISQIAKTAGVGKGTIYEYFENKEDIVFEIITVFIAEYEQILQELVSQNISTKEKVFHFLCQIHEEKEGKRQLKIYREFLAISLSNGTEGMIDFNIKCRMQFTIILENILQEGIRKKEISVKALDFVSALLVYKLGLVIESHTAGLDVKRDAEVYLNALFTLIEIKGQR